MQLYNKIGSICDVSGFLLMLYEHRDTKTQSFFIICGAIKLCASVSLCSILYQLFLMIT